MYFHLILNDHNNFNPILEIFRKMKKKKRIRILKYRSLFNPIIAETHRELMQFFPKPLPHIALEEEEKKGNR